MFCGKCRKHYETGGAGKGRQYRCAKCHAQRLAAMLTGEAKVKGRIWTPEEVQVLESLWATAPINDVYAAFPGRTEDSIRTAALRKGLTRPPELVAESLRERALKGAETLRKHRERLEHEEDARLAPRQVITRDFAPIKVSTDEITRVMTQWGRS